ncbi:MAG: 3-methyl-2-oxobutanoate hydroxymethyltransferase, partial [Calditrichaeota bacterium]|nr:3-methyl-2-oxobutanoate hydroxymethyltransferase [Calditrichota bacterium]
MSTHKSDIKQVSAQQIIRFKAEGKKITVLTAYDFITARILDEAGVDIVLIGDSLNMVFAGKENTLSATVDQMLYHSKIVASAVKRSLVVTDMPFLSFQVSTSEAIKNAGKFIAEAGVQAVKIEGGRRNKKLIRKLVDIGIPVMGHLGLTPQSIQQFGSYELRAKQEAESKQLMDDAKILEDAGCFSIVLEKIPAALAKDVSESLTIPTIGIGAGLHCDGQVLVTQDILGLFDLFKPKFVRRYNNMADQMRKNVADFIADI